MVNRDYSFVPYDNVNTRGQNVRYLAKYIGSKGNIYNIINGADATTYCTCHAWKMKKKCKHLSHYLQEEYESAIQDTRKKNMNDDEKINSSINEAVAMLTGKDTSDDGLPF